MERAQELLAQGKLEEARSQVNEVLGREPRNVSALLLRSTLRTRTGELAEALADAEEAVRQSKGSAESQLRRAISLWRLQDYGKAKCVSKWLDDSQAASMWKSMIAARSEPEEAVLAIPAAKQDSQASKSQNSSVMLSQSQASASAPQPPRVDWYQSGDVVYITLYRKGLPESGTEIRISERELKVVSGENDFNWVLPLGHRVLVEASTHELTPYKVEFALKKADNVRWGKLESDAEDSASVPVPPAAKPTPQTSYSKWEHLDADDADEKNEGDPNAFFQELYKNAAPEVQRAMMKSFVESNGTALSTNWDEVKKGKVETQPPKDMEARSWN